MHLFEFDSLDRAVLELLRSIDEEGDEAIPRGMRTKELLNVCFKLTNPRARLVFSAERRWSFPLAVGEFLWHFAGRNDSPSISHYAPRWADFSHDGVITSSCYGFKIFRSENGRPSQWSLVSELLKSDPSTRRAVINLYDADEDLQPDAADVACATTLQFFIRGGRLHLTTHMRSNDAVWGLPYDCFIMTMLQESLAKQLGCPLGEYVHYAGSLHVYERHFPLIERILTAAEESEGFSMPHMPGAIPTDSLFSYEQLIREKEPVLDFADLPTYWKDLLLVLSFHKAHRLNLKGRKREIVAEISEGAYKHLLSRSLPSTAIQCG